MQRKLKSHKNAGRRKPQSAAPRPQPTYGTHEKLSLHARGVFLCVCICA